jgi:hypothetical protein
MEVYRGNIRTRGLIDSITNEEVNTKYLILYFYELLTAPTIVTQ